VAGPPSEAFGEKLERLRKQRFLSRQALASASAVPYPTIRDLEHGKTRAPRLSTIKNLADALELRDSERSEFLASARERAREYPRKPVTQTRPGAEDPDDEATAREPVARTLPRDIGSFVGRETEMRKLLEAADDVALAGGVGGLFAIEGMGGVGKTTLAVHAAYKVIEEFPDEFRDGHIFLDLRGYTQGLPALTAHQALRSLLLMLNVSNDKIPDDRALREQLYRSTVADKSSLIILDNAYDAAQIKPLLAGTAKCVVIVTSRANLRSLDDAKVLSLGTLSEADAIALFYSVAAREREASGGPDLAAEIVKLCGYLPLGIRMVAARLSRRPALDMANVLAELRQEHNRLADLRDSERSVTAVFESSLSHVNSQEQRLFRQLALIPGPDFDGYAAASLSGASFRATKLALESLLDHNLLVQRAANRYEFHDLVRVFARSLRPPAVERAIDNVLNFYLYSARLADQTFERGLPRADSATAGARDSLGQPAAVPELRTSAQAQAWLSAEAANLSAAARFAARKGRPRITIGLAAALSDYLRACGPWAQALDLHRAALKAAIDGHDRPSQADAYRSIGGVQSRIGDIPQSKQMQGRALAIYRELGDKRGAARVLIELGIAQRVAGDAECLAGFTEALDLYRELGDLRGQAAALTELGSMRWQIGPIPEAERNLLEALRIYRELGNRQGETAALLYLGNVQLAGGALAAAMESLREAEAIGTDLGQPVLVANSLLYRGDVQRAAGLAEEARDCVSRALEVYTGLSHHQGIATALAYLGETLTLAGEHGPADEHFRQALDVFDKLGDPQGKSEALNSYAGLARAVGDPELARARYAEGLRLAEMASSARDKADALAGLAAVDEELGRKDEATEDYRKALAIYQTMEAAPDVARVRQALDRLIGAGPPRQVLRNQDDLAADVAGFESAVGLADLVQRVRCGDRDLELAAGDEPGELGQRPRAGADRVALRFHPVLFRGVEADDRVDAARLDAKLIDGQLDVVTAVGVDERVDLGRGLADVVRDALAVADRDHAVRCEPRVVGRARQADHCRPRSPRELYGDRADPARRAGDHERVARAYGDRAHGRPGGEPGNGQRACRFPRHRHGLRHHVGRLDQGEFRLARPGVDPADHLVADRHAGHARAELVDDPGQVGALPGRERRGPAGVQGTVPDLRLARVDAGRLHPDDDLAGTRDRPRHLRHVQDVHSTVLVEPYRLHLAASGLATDNDPVDGNAPLWSNDVWQADWIAGRLSPWAGDYPITIHIPAGFEAYARVLHPVEVPDDGGRLVRWSEVAAWSGLPLRDDAQFHSIALPPRDPGGPPPFDGQGPREGTLWTEDAKVLAAIACGWTVTPEDCWFCIWDGFSWDGVSVSAVFTADGQPPEHAEEPRRNPVPARVRDGPRVRLPHREYLLYAGPAEDVVAPAELAGDGQCASLWWPADRAWCVATDVDLPWTYVGGPRGLIDAIRADRRIEALPASPGDPLSRVEDWVSAWIRELTDDLLARGEAALTTCRGSIEASLRRPGRLRNGELRTSVTGTRDYTSTGRATLTGGRDLREQLALQLRFAVLSLAGM
jgi:tetratricopeptide (TPR) repeat protein/transcriptional regulator with XRE-family HTH domain